jgi:hypothetical protein
MEELIDSIVEKVGFTREDQFKTYLLKCIHVSKDTVKSTYAVHDNMALKLDRFFAGFSPWNNECGKGNIMEAGVKVLCAICDALDIEVTPEECFILFHLREQGKFRKKESDLHKELKILWRQHKQFAMEDGDFSYALKNLMRKKFINYRRGNLHINNTVIINYRTR